MLRHRQPPLPPHRLAALVGLLLLSAASGRECLADLARCQALVMPACCFDWHEADGRVFCVLAPRPAIDEPSAPQGLRTIEPLSQLATSLRDALGGSTWPLFATLTQRRPVDPMACERALQCACRFGAPRDALVYPASLLACPALRADTLAHQALQAACDEQLGRLCAAAGMAGRVRQVLARLGDPAAGMASVAAALRLTPRTLRRRLAEEGATFSAIVHQLKLGVATRALECSEAAIDEVAARAGFSDAANFRRAFIRWTRLSPAQYRRQHRDRGPGGPLSPLH